MCHILALVWNVLNLIEYYVLENKDTWGNKLNHIDENT